MLRITVPPNNTPQLTFSTFEEYLIPAPPGGVDAEINNSLVLLFEDEDEAMSYADELEDLSAQLDDTSTPQYMAINEIIMAIRNDEFVQSYSR